MISSSSRLPESRSIASTLSTRRAKSVAAAGRETRSRPARCAARRARSRQACANTHSPSGTMSPVRSAHGMNSLGPIGGERSQRTRASAAMVVRPLRSTSGWYTVRKRPLAMASELAAELVRAARGGSRPPLRCWHCGAPAARLCGLQDSGLIAPSVASSAAVDRAGLPVKDGGPVAWSIGRCFQVAHPWLPDWRPACSSWI